MNIYGNENITFMNGNAKETQLQDATDTQDANNTNDTKVANEADADSVTETSGVTGVNDTNGVNDANSVNNVNVVTGANDANGANGASDEITLTIGYILSQMEKIRTDNGYIMEALNKIMDIESHPPTMNAADYGAQAKAEAIGDIVKAREATNQKLLATYEQMYDDIKPKKERPESEKEKILQWAAEMIPGNQLFAEGFGVELGKLLKEMYI